MEEVSRLVFHRSEICLYYAVYFAYLLYGLWTLFSLRDELQHKAGYIRDPYNYELDIFNNYIQLNWHWYLAHAVITTVSRFVLTKENMGISFACVSLTSLLISLPWKMFVFVVILLIIFYLVSRIGSRVIVWCITALWVSVLNILAIYFINPADDNHSFYIFSVILFWMLLRCCSFAHYCVDSKFSKDKLLGEATVTDFLGYTLYFPTLVNGPFLDYKRYITLLQKPSLPGFSYDIKTLVYELVRIFFWWLALELGMRCLFVHYMSMEIKTAKLVKSPFGRHAIGYFLGQFFFLTYFVKYGLGIAFAQYDGMKPPNKPQCIGHVHYYSNMWKHFDQGLYEFLFDYIYHPLVKANCSKFVSTVLTFAFVFMWHGCQTDILIWTVMNFWCLIVEKMLKNCMRSLHYRKWVEINFGLSTAQRFKAIVFSQLFIVAAFSNIFFIGSPKMGVFLIMNAYGNGFLNYLILSFCCYCFFQCSELISMKLWNRNVKNRTKIKSN
uniref:Protein-cysteine N-palmitoyltransferase Rasp n=1 Tax=Ceratitis capitata TaxID=7213 RepID=W8C871_CERCA